jgi:hypothetical protein
MLTAKSRTTIANQFLIISLYEHKYTFSTKPYGLAFDY